VRKKHFSIKFFSKMAKAKKVKALKYGIIKSAAEAAEWGYKWFECKIGCNEADKNLKEVTDALMEYNAITGEDSFGKAKICTRKSIELKGEGVGKELRDKVKIFTDALPDTYKKVAADLKLILDNINDPRAQKALSDAGLELVEKQSKFIGSV
jgi:hypothetical protein